jgi:hypothetical protein
MSVGLDKTRFIWDNNRRTMTDNDLKPSDRYISILIFHPLYFTGESAQIEYHSMPEQC